MVSLQDTTYRAPPIPHVTVQSLSATSPHGVPTRKLTRDIQGTPTDICIQEYLDRTFVIVTQVGKLGVVTQASLPTDTPFSAAPTNNGTGVDTFDDFDEDDHDSASAAASTSDPLPLPSNLVQTPLLGVAPEDYTHLYSLYVSCIFSALRPDPQQQGTSNNTSQDDGRAETTADERPVIVALGLKLNSSAADEVATTADIAEQQRDSFVQIIQAVKDCQNQLQ